MTASLETARKSASNENYNTTDEERFGRGRRMHVRYNRYNDEEDEEEEEIVQPTKCKIRSTYLKSSCILYVAINFYL